MKNVTFSRVLVLPVLLVGTLGMQSCKKDNVLGTDLHDPQSVLQDKFSSYELVDIDVAGLFHKAKAHGGELFLDLGVETHPDWTMHVGKKGYPLDEPIELFVDGKLQSDLPEIYSMVGSMTGRSEDVCTVTLGEDFLSVYFMLNGEEHFIEPLWIYDASADHNVYVAYRGSEVRPEDQGCMNDPSDMPVEEATFPAWEGDPDGLGYAKATCKKPTVLATANYSFYTRYGSNVSNCYAALQAHVDQAAVKYWSNSSVYIDMYISKYFIVTWNWDMYNSNDASTLLNNYRFSINEYYPSYKKNINILFTGHDFVGTGRAWVAKVCNSTSYPYAIVDANVNRSYATIAKTTAHETGHLYSAADETSSTYIMGSAGTQCCFSYGSKQSINAHKNANDCTGAWTCS